MYEQYADQDVLVFALHPGDPPDQIADFIEQTGITFPVLADQSTLFEFSYPNGVGYPYPRDIVIGKDLKVRSIKNSFNGQEMDALITQLLAE